MLQHYGLPKVSFAVFTLLLLLLTYAWPCDSKVVEGTLNAGPGWHFLAKFCFDNDGDGLLIATFTKNPVPDTKPVALLLYSDEETSWGEVYKSSMPCDQKKKYAKNAASPKLLPESVEKTYQSSTSVAKRQRFWYIVLSNCDGTLDVDYKLTFTNGRGLMKHFSYEDQGLLQLYIAMSVYYGLLSILVVYVLVKMHRRKMMHASVIILSCSHGIEFLSCLLLMVQWSIYSDNGIGSKGLEVFGEALGVIGYLMFMFVLFCVAKGWNITTTKLNNKRYIAAGYGVVVAIYIALFIVAQSMDKATVLYKYESAPGVLLLVANIICLIAFWVLLLRTWVFEQTIKKRQFYLIFGSCYSAWYLSLPVAVLLAFFIDPWMRRIVVESMLQVSIGLGYLVMPFLALPSKVYEVYGSVQTGQSIPTLQAMQRIQPVATVPGDGDGEHFQLESW